MNCAELTMNSREKMNAPIPYFLFPSPQSPAIPVSPESTAKAEKPVIQDSAKSAETFVSTGSCAAHAYQP